VLFVVECGA